MEVNPMLNPQSQKQTGEIKKNTKEITVIAMNFSIFDERTIFLLLRND